MLVHLAQEPIVDPLVDAASKHRVESAVRAQRRLVRIDPRLDLGGREPLEAEKARTVPACLELGAMLCGPNLGCDVKRRIDGGSGSGSRLCGRRFGCCHGVPAGTRRSLYTMAAVHATFDRRRRPDDSRRSAATTRGARVEDRGQERPDHEPRACRISRRNEVWTRFARSVSSATNAAAGGPACECA